jgi:ribonuclease T1
MSAALRSFAVLALLAIGLASGPVNAQKAQPTLAPAQIPDVSPAELPKEARDTLALIRKGGPFPYAKDGAIFSNREGILPKQKRGYYKEYTVKTPHERTRGARRIIWGKGGEFFYTEDHYNHFSRIH